MKTTISILFILVVLLGSACQDNDNDDVNQPNENFSESAWSGIIVSKNDKGDEEYRFDILFKTQSEGNYIIYKYKDNRKQTDSISIEYKVVGKTISIYSNAKDGISGEWQFEKQSQTAMCLKRDINNNQEKIIYLHKSNKLQPPSEIKDLNTLIQENDIVYLEPKIYQLKSTLIIPSGKKIIGIRGKTIIKVPKDLKIGVNLLNVRDVVIENVTIEGSYNGTPTKVGLQPVRSGLINFPEDIYKWKGAGYNTDMINGGATSEYIPQIGININACERIEILGSEIKNFSWAGIANRLSGKNYQYAIKIGDNYINNCYCGIYLYDEAERSQYIANNISLCQIGLFLDSGTNTFYGIAFTANRVGLVLSNGWNHAHGEFTDCSFTHCSLFSIIAKDIEHGQVFEGCKIGYCDAEAGNNGYCMLIKNSRGIAFNNGRLFNANVKFEGKFYKHGVSFSVGNPDQFNNIQNVMTFQNVLEETSNYNGGVNKFLNNQVTSGSFVLLDGLTSSNVILKDNYYISGRDSKDLNSKN